MRRVIRGVWGATPIALIQDENVTHAALRAYIALASFQGTKEDCYPGVEDIAERAGLGKRSVEEGLRVLKAAGWIVVQRRGLGKTNVYRVLVDAEDCGSRTADIDADQDPQDSADQEPQTSADHSLSLTPISSSTSENTTGKHTEAVASAVRSVFKSTMQELEKIHGQQFANYAREGAALKALLTSVARMFPERNPGELVAWMGRYLHSLQKGRDRFWRGMAVSPSSLRSNWDRLYTMAKAKASEQDWEGMGVPWKRSGTDTGKGGRA